MRTQNKLLTMLILVGTTTVITTLAAMNVQDGSKSSRTGAEKNKERLNKLPVADYETPESSNADEREKRRAKKRRYNDTPDSKIDPSAAFVERVSSYDWEWGLESALPTGQSSAIVVGEITDARAYLSEDKANVYSEFKVSVEKVIKNDSNEPIAVGDSIILDRIGGRVRTPAGHIQSYTVRGRGTPQVGLRYLFFLGYNKRESSIRRLPSADEMNRHILTAYELRDGKVAPLDNAGGQNFKMNEGVDETSFLNEIQRSLSRQPQ